MAIHEKNATKLGIKRGERKVILPPATLLVGGEERETGEGVSDEREGERERFVRSKQMKEERRRGLKIACWSCWFHSERRRFARSKRRRFG